LSINGLFHFVCFAVLLALAVVVDHSAIRNAWARALIPCKIAAYVSQNHCVILNTHDEVISSSDKKARGSLFATISLTALGWTQASLLLLFCFLLKAEGHQDALPVALQTLCWLSLPPSPIAGDENIWCSSSEGRRDPAKTRDGKAHWCKETSATAASPFEPTTWMSRQAF